MIYTMYNFKLSVGDLICRKYIVLGTGTTEQPRCMCFTYATIGSPCPRDYVAVHLCKDMKKMLCCREPGKVYDKSSAVISRNDAKLIL